MNTSTGLFVLWVFFTLIVMGVSVVSLFTVQSVIDRLRLVDTKNWNEGDYKTMKEIVKTNLTWVVLVAVCVAELVSLAFEPIRLWFVNSIFIASIAYLVPILVLVVVLIIQRVQAQSPTTPAPSTEEPEE